MGAMYAKVERYGTISILIALSTSCIVRLRGPLMETDTCSIYAKWNIYNSTCKHMYT